MRLSPVRNHPDWVPLIFGPSFKEAIIAVYLVGVQVGLLAGFIPWTALRSLMPGSDVPTFVGFVLTAAGSSLYFWRIGRLR